MYVYHVSSPQKLHVEVLFFCKSPDSPVFFFFFVAIKSVFFCGFLGAQISMFFLGGLFNVNFLEGGGVECR